MITDNKLSKKVDKLAIDFNEWHRVGTSLVNDIKQIKSHPLYNSKYDNVIDEILQYIIGDDWIWYK